MSLRKDIREAINVRPWKVGTKETGIIEIRTLFEIMKKLKRTEEWNKHYKNLDELRKYLDEQSRK